jgi:tetratricopeptide (TPR) repeat protein
MDANRRIRERQGQLPGETFPELLDRYGVDVFFGIGTPVMRDTARPVSYSTTLLERTPGWILVFRDYRSAVYLRANARNRENLERVAAWYAKQGVPFDPEEGLDLHTVIQRSLGWAVRDGVVGYDLAALIEASNSFDAARREVAHAQLARRYAVLGLYEDAIRSDRRLLHSQPDDPGARRRIVWSLLHLGRVQEANDAAKDLGDDPLSGLLRRAAEEARTMDDDALRAMVAKIPILDERELASIALGTLAPEVRRDR